MLSEHNQFQFLLTPPPRGLILDRNGVVLASNRPDFRLLLAKDDDTDIDAILAKIAQLIPMDDAHRARLAADIDAAPQQGAGDSDGGHELGSSSRPSTRARPSCPASRPTWARFASIHFSGAFAHVIGYVAKVSASDVTKTGPNSEADHAQPGIQDRQARR